MKLFQKAAAVLMAAVLSLSLLTACGGSGSVVTSPKDLATRAEDAYMAIFNAAFGTTLENDATLKDAAKEKLKLIDENGMIAESDVLGFLGDNSLAMYMIIPSSTAEVPGNFLAERLTKEDVLQLENPSNLEVLKNQYKSLYDSLLSGYRIEKLAVAAEARGEAVYYVIAVQVQVQLPTT